MGLVARGPELLNFLDRLAHEDLEVELEGEEGDGTKKKKLHKSFAPLPQIVEILERECEQVFKGQQTSGRSDSVACPQIRDGSALWRMPAHELVQP
jgi:hypothetical protein